ncbi:MAG: hypothetical protein U1E76_02410 [Planctomycetota bacterium]
MSASRIATLVLLAIVAGLALGGAYPARRSAAPRLGAIGIEGKVTAARSRARAAQPGARGRPGRSL